MSKWIKFPLLSLATEQTGGSRVHELFIWSQLELEAKALEQVFYLDVIPATDHGRNNYCKKYYKKETTITLKRLSQTRWVQQWLGSAMLNSKNNEDKFAKLRLQDTNFNQRILYSPAKTPFNLNQTNLYMLSTQLNKLFLLFLFSSFLFLFPRARHKLKLFPTLLLTKKQQTNCTYRKWNSC